MEDTLCWTMHENPTLLLVVRVPIMLSIVVRSSHMIHSSTSELHARCLNYPFSPIIRSSQINSLLFFNVVRVLYTKLKMSMYLQRRKMKYKSVRQSFRFSRLIVYNKLYEVSDSL